VPWDKGVLFHYAEGSQNQAGECLSAETFGRTRRSEESSLSSEDEYHRDYLVANTDVFAVGCFSA